MEEQIDECENFIPVVSDFKQKADSKSMDEDFSDNVHFSNDLQLLIRDKDVQDGKDSMGRQCQC